MPRTSARSGFYRHGGRAWAVILCLAAVCLAGGETSRKSAENNAAEDKPAGDKPHTGQAIYAQQCAACHGANGEGTKENFPRPLAGDRSLGQLAAYVAKSMPEDSPGSCTGDDAKNVSAYIYDKFYSPAARARNQPARVELARLTVNQYANSAADLIGSFRGRADHNDPTGLNADYTTRHRKKDQVRDDSPVAQIDPKIDFDFGTTGPLKGRIGPDEYEIHWRGALWAPETGDYEFNLETSNGARLWLNDNERPLIDAWVRSGTKTEHRESIRLLGGRKYPLRVDFSKGKNEAGHIDL